MPTSYKDDWVNERMCDFNWQAVLHDLESPTKSDGIPRMAIALSRLLDWLLTANLTRKNALRTIGLRTVALAWVIDPKRFEGASLHTLAKKFGFTAPVLSVKCADFARKFHIHNKYQNHDWRTRRYVKT
jgi:hypothetical protein